MGNSTRRWLVTGASGQLGSHLLQALRESGEADVAAWTARTTGTMSGYELLPTDLTDPSRIRAAFARAAPSIVIHAAALSRIDQCYEHPQLARSVNVDATRELAELAERHGARLVYLSTDLVFDGRRGNYTEQDVPHPLSTYGRTKHESESQVVDRGLVVRVSLMYGPSLNGRPTFFEQQRARLLAGEPVELFDDEWRSPLDLSTAARAVLAAATQPLNGVLHVAGPERLSRWEMGLKLAHCLGVDPSLVRRGSGEGRFPEPRPRDVSLCTKSWREQFPALAWPTMDRVLEFATFVRRDPA